MALYVEQLSCHRVGRPESELLSSELIPLLESAAYLEKVAPEVLGEEVVSGKGRPPWLWGVDIAQSREPHGLVLIVGPSNYPLFLPGSQALFALAAGNAVLLKPAPGTAPLMRMMAQDLPEGLLTVLSEEPEEVGRALGGVDKVVMTGSEATGRAILPEAAKNLVPAVAELSGCDLLWAHPEANLELVAQALAFGLSLNDGRTCMAPRRLLLPSSWKGRFGSRLQHYLSRYPEVSLERDFEEGKALVGSRERGPLVISELESEHELWREGAFTSVAVAAFVGGLEEASPYLESSDSALTCALFGPEDWALQVSLKSAGGSSRDQRSYRPDR